MNYTDTFNEIVKRYNVELIGWTHKLFANPSLLGTQVPPLEKLVKALEEDKCKFVRLSAEQVAEKAAAHARAIKAGEIVVKERKRRSDAGKKRNAKGKTALSDEVINSSDEEVEVEPLDEDSDTADSEEGGGPPSKKRKTAIQPPPAPKTTPRSHTAAHAPTTAATETAPPSAAAAVSDTAAPTEPSPVPSFAPTIPVPANAKGVSKNGKGKKRKASDIENIPMAPPPTLPPPYVTRGNRVSRPTEKVREAQLAGDNVLGGSRQANIIP